MSDSLAGTAITFRRIRLTQLHVSEVDQVRVKGINQSHVNELAEALAETPFDQWPKLLVTPWSEDLDEGYAVLGGNHTIAVAERLGMEALVCRVIPDGDWEAAFEDNRLHGLGPSSADQKLQARRLADRYPQMSYREIGRRAGLSDKTVKRALTEIQGAENPRPAPDPVARFVGQVYRLADGSEVRTATLRREIEAYDHKWQADIATALDAIGRACVAAAEPYLGEGN